MQLWRTHKKHIQLKTHYYSYKVGMKTVTQGKTLLHSYGRKSQNNKRERKQRNLREVSFFYP